MSTPINQAGHRWKMDGAPKYTQACKECGCAVEEEDGWMFYPESGPKARVRCMACFNRARMTGYLSYQKAQYGRGIPKPEARELRFHISREDSIGLSDGMIDAVSEFLCRLQDDGWTLTGPNGQWGDIVMGGPLAALIHLLAEVLEQGSEAA